MLSAMSPSYALLLIGGLALALILVAGPVSSEQIKYSYCGSSELDCAISNAAITPCIGIEKDACKIKRDTNATLTFDFIPHWTPGENQLKTRAYWSQLLDLPFVGMNTDACKYVACPLVKDQPNSYNFTLHLSKIYLAQRYDIKFKIWEDEKTEKECCLVFKLRLI